MWTNKAAHVLYDAQDPHSCLLTEGNLSPHIPSGDRLQPTQDQEMHVCMEARQCLGDFLGMKTASVLRQNVFIN